LVIVDVAEEVLTGNVSLTQKSPKVSPLSDELTRTKGLMLTNSSSVVFEIVTIASTLFWSVNRSKWKSYRLSV